MKKLSLILICLTLLLYSGCSVTDVNETESVSNASEQLSEIVSDDPVLVEGYYIVESETGSYVTEGIPPEKSKTQEMPINDTQDISDAFSVDLNMSFDEDQEKLSLTCNYMDANHYAISEQTLILSENHHPKLRLHCTWGSPAIKVYVGLKNSESDAVYTISAVGGYLVGDLALDGLPDGEYQIILYGDNNPSLVAALLYQIENDVE